MQHDLKRTLSETKKTSRIFFTRAILACAIALFSTMPAAWGQQPQFLGEQFRVNTYSPNRQNEAAVARDSQGDFVAVWQSDGSDNGDTVGFSIQGQRFEADGTPIAHQFRVNTTILTDQLLPAIAMDAAGDFVVVWLSDEGSGQPFGYRIYGQRFAADGSPVGGQFQVNSRDTKAQGKPSVAMDSAGNFTVVWENDPQEAGDGSGSNIRGRRFTANGTALGPEFDINAYRPGRQHSPRAVKDALGELVVIWASFGSDNGDSSGQSIQGQRFAVDGTPIGPQFLVNSLTRNDQAHPRAAMDDSGNFVVTWESDRADKPDSDGFSIQARRFANDGTPQGGQFVVNSFTESDQRMPEITMDGTGNFIIVWTSFGSDGTDNHQFSIQGQRFSANGSPIGDQFQANNYTPKSQFSPVVAADGPGNFVVMWTAETSDNGDFSHFSVQGQRFCSSNCRSSPGLRHLASSVD